MGEDRRVAVVLGGAACLADDLARFRRMTPKVPTYVAVNDAGWVCAPIADHWATMHPENFPRWLALVPEYRRNRMDLWTAVGRIPDGMADVCDHVIPTIDKEGSSGMFGVAVAHELGASKVVLCGVPIDAQANVNGAESWPQYEVHRAAWVRSKSRLANVRSMSGWTQTLLGPPTREWLDEP